MKKIMYYIQKHLIIIVITMMSIIFCCSITSMIFTFKLNSINFWNMFWTMIAAFSIPTSLFIFNREEQIRTETEKKQQEVDKQNQKAERLTELIQNDIPEFWAIREKNNKQKSDDIELLLQKGISILLSVDSLITTKDIDPAEDTTLNTYISLVCSEMDKYRKLFTDDFKLDSVLSYYLDTDSTNDIDDTNVELITSSQVLIVRTVQKNDILGNWYISKKNARNIKYVIGVYGYVNTKNKKYIQTIKVKKYEVIDNTHIRFKADNEEKHEVSNNNLLDLLKSITGYKTDDSGIKEQVEYIINRTGWKGINPTVYLSHLKYLFSQQIIYQTFEDKFSQKITEYNARNSNKNSDYLQVVEKLNEPRNDGFFRIRFRSTKLDSILKDKYDETHAYTDYSHWYEIISDNHLNTINFASVFFLNNSSNGTEVIKNFYNYKTAQKPEEMVTPFVENDTKKNGYIITIDKLSKNDIHDQKSLTHFFTNIFNEIDKDIELVEKITK